jgi:NTP pyrophosphatase (non-canonical NTP hydrolase)
VVIEVVILFEHPRCQAVRGTLSGGSGTVCTMDIRELTARVENISQIYASRFGITRDDDWQILKLQEEVGELTQAHLMRQGQARRKGLSHAQIEARFRAEVADVLSQILLLAHHHDIDVVDEIERKWFVWQDASPRPEDVLANEA